MTNIAPDWPQWGSTGEQPPDGSDRKGGDPFFAKYLDYLWYHIRTSFEAVDSETEDIKSGAISVGQADNATTVKGNDIDSDGDGIVNEADSAANADAVDGIQASTLTSRGDLASLPSADIQAGSAIQMTPLPSLPSNTTLRVKTVSCASYTDSDSSYTTPTNLSVVVYDLDADSVIASWASGFTEVNTDYDVSNTNVGIYVDNGRFETGTGSEQRNVSAGLEYVLV